MSSTSPGHVIRGVDPERRSHNTPNGAPAVGDASTALRRATTQKRARDSPTTPSSARALALIGSITDSVRTSAVRGLRALTDSIDRGRDDASSASGSDPPSPTAAHVALRATPAGKRRRTVLTEARLRDTHAHWRGTQWDYSGAMSAKLFYHVADSGPSAFPLPQTSTETADDREVAAQGEGRDVRGYDIARPPSAMSTASAPAALSTPQSHHHRRHVPTPSTRDEREAEQGWVTTYVGDQDDPFMVVDGDEGSTGIEGSAQDELPSPLALAVTQAASMLNSAALRSPTACGAILDFQLRLRALDPQGNFTPQCPTGDVAISELRELRTAVDEMRKAQTVTENTLRELLAGRASDTKAPASRQHTTETPAHPPAELPRAQREPAAVPDTAEPMSTESSPRATTPERTPTTETARTPTTQKEVGRHDERRAVFCPVTAFGGRIPLPASADEVRRLNNLSYQVRDAVNLALRELAVAGMHEDAVQVVGVNWTERGNLCAVVCDGFSAAQLLAHANTVAEAAGLGRDFTAHRDVPIFKAVLCNVPTKKADGTLFTELEVLTDLRTHSTAFDSLKLADTAESARWISTTGVRTLKPRSTLLLNFASASDADAFTAMHRRLFAFGCMCEPGVFQPRDRDRICNRCWNPLARHRERDFVCRERCRLCGEAHIEEDHTCPTCDALAKPCAHIKLKCVNCGLEHAADDSVCEYRRRTRGVSQSAPPMSGRKNTHTTTTQAPDATKTKRKARKKNVRVLEPHEPFPDEEIAAPAPPNPQSVTLARPAPARSHATPVSTSTTMGTSPLVSQSVQSTENGRRTRRGEGSSKQSPPAAPRQDAPPQETEEEEVEMDAAERAALSDLVGAVNVRDDVAMEGEGTTPADANTTDSARRTSSSRIAASEAAKEDKRRKVAHVLTRSFSFLSHPNAVAALKARMDDYVSTVSWAAEEQTRRRKPGMPAKTDAGLRKIVEEMKKTSADRAITTTSTPDVTHTVVNA